MEGEPSGSSPQNESTADPEALEEEVVRLRTELDRAKAVKARRTRGIATAALAVLTTISVIAGTVAFWGHRTIFDQDHYMHVVAPLGSDPAVTTAVSNYLTKQVVTALDLKKRIAEALAGIPELPEKADVLTGPVANAVANAANGLIQRRIDEYVASQDFRNLWVAINRVGHEKVLALLRGDYSKLPNVKVGDAEVRLNLLPILSRVLHQLVQDGVGRVAPGVTVPDVTLKDIPDSARQHLSEALGVTLPSDFGEVTIMSRKKLESLQGAVDSFNRMVWGLILLSILLAGATIVVAVNKRRALVEVAGGVVVGLVLATVVIRKVKTAVLDRIDSGDGRGAARSVMDTTLGSLRAVAVVVIVTAAVIAVVAHLAGRPRWLTGSYHWVRTQVGRPDTRSRIAQNADGLRVAVIALGVLVLFFTGVDVLPVVIVAAVVALCLLGLDAAKRAEAPPPGEGGTHSPGPATTSARDAP